MIGIARTAQEYCACIHPDIHTFIHIYIYIYTNRMQGLGVHGMARKALEENAPRTLKIPRTSA